MNNIDYYPAIEHENASKKIVEIFKKDKRVMSILLTCSCARGKATRDSCLDIYIIVKKRRMAKDVNRKFERLYAKVKEFRKLRKVGRYSHIDFSVIDGKIEIKERDWTSGPDNYELEIGNIFIYSVILFDRNNYFKKLKKKYIPYYSEKLRKKRLKEVKKYLFNNLDHIPFYVNRKLYFQAFDRLYKANQEFMQAVFIKKKIYPISFDKWIKEQFVEILKMPKAYKQIVNIIEIKKFESKEIENKAKKLRKLAIRYL